MADFTIKRNDTLPALAVQLTDTVNGVTTPVDLTTATGVKLIMRKKGASGTPAVNAACTFIDRTTGKVSYQWVLADTSDPGDFDAEFQVTWTGGGRETFPNDVPTGAQSAFYTISVVADLGD